MTGIGLQILTIVLIMLNDRVDEVNDHLDYIHLIV